jgi:hypothetical protein
MFAIFIILSIVNVCYIQAKMSVALATATKELSQYSYVYYALNGDVGQQKLIENAELMDGIFSDIESLTSKDSGSSVSETYDTVGSLADGLEAVSDDPAAALVSLFAGLTNEGIDLAKNTAGETAIKYLIQKNLTNDGTGGADRFLRNLHVIGGMSGLGVQASILSNGEPTISVTVEYDVEILPLLNIENDLHFRQTAQTQAWGRGK